MAHKKRFVCGNYLYLSQKLEEIEDAASREAFLDAVAHGSAISWQHIKLLDVELLEFGLPINDI